MRIRSVAFRGLAAFVPSHPLSFAKPDHYRFTAKLVSRGAILYSERSLVAEDVSPRWNRHETLGRQMLKIVQLIAFAFVAWSATALNGAEPAKPEPQTLLATDLTGWVEEQHGFYKKKHPNTTTWSVWDGVVHCDGSTGNCGFLRYEKKLCDFTLTLEYRITKKCNSGICFRAALPYTTLNPNTLPSNTGFELQIMDDAEQPASNTGTGAIYNQIAPPENVGKKVGEWNTVELDCRGSVVRAKLNGKLVQDFDYTQIPALAKRESCGYIALQNHGGTADFRNIKLVELK